MQYGYGEEQHNDGPVERFLRSIIREAATALTELQEENAAFLDVIGEESARATEAEARLRRIEEAQDRLVAASFCGRTALNVGRYKYVTCLKPTDHPGECSSEDKHFIDDVKMYREAREDTRATLNEKKS